MVGQRRREHQSDRRDTSHAVAFGEGAESPALPCRGQRGGGCMPDVSVTWLGHASHRIDSPNGRRIYTDPWLGNPKCPEGEKEPERVDVIALTHGHGDHLGETVELAQRFSPRILGIIELLDWLESEKGIEADPSLSF